MNNRGIEGLPLKYILIILIAAMSISMVFNIMGKVSTGLEGATDNVVSETNSTSNLAMLKAKCEVSGGIQNECNCLDDATFRQNNPSVCNKYGL